VQSPIGRACGSCSICCKIFPIIDHEEIIPIKPADEWCKHCTPGRGCSIYEERPRVCRDYYCDWLVDKRLDDKWKPDRSKMIVHHNWKDGTLFRRIFVDASYPSKWREEPYYSDVKNMSRAGLTLGKENEFTTMVHSTSGLFVVLPNKNVEVDLGETFRIDQIGDDEWDVIIDE
jgi:hypothetical protein